MHHPTERIVHDTAIVTPVVEHWLECVIIEGGLVTIILFLLPGKAYNCGYNL